MTTFVHRGTRRRVLHAAATAAGGGSLGALLAACAGLGGGAGAPGAPSSTAVTGKVRYSVSIGNPSVQAFWDTTVRTFHNDHPGVEIELEKVALAERQTRDDQLFAFLAAGTIWDVWARDVGTSYQQPLVEKKAVLELDRYFATMPNLKRVFPWARERAKVAGKTYGVPHAVEYIATYYNIPAFRRAGIDKPPTTWNEWVDVNQTLKAAGILPLNIQKNRTNPGHNYSTVLMGLIGKDGFEDLLWRQTRRWDREPGVARAAETMVEMQRQGFLPADTTTGPLDVAKDFPNGTTAMWIQGSWGVAEFDRARNDVPGFEYSFFPLPSQDAKIPPTLAGGLGGGNSVWSETKVRDAAVTWLDWLTSPTAQKLYIELRSQVAPVPFKVEDYQVSEGFKQVLQLLVNAESMGYNVSVVVPAGFVDAYWDGLIEILSQKLTPNEWVRRLQQQWDIAKQENRTPRP